MTVTTEKTSRISSTISRPAESSPHLVSVVDFAEKMNPGHTAEDLAETQAAFAELVAAGVFEARSKDEFILTAKGLDLLRAERAHHPA
jgi:hypothetical protein